MRTSNITGVTSGIGRETAILLAKAGASVVVSGRNAERGAETVAAIDAAGGEASFVAADMGDVDSVRHLAEEVGDIDILVNNAGIFPFAATVEQDVGSFEAIFDVNVRAPFFLTAALARKMVAKGRGSIVNISTMAATIGLPGAAAYSASKAALGEDDVERQGKETLLARAAEPEEIAEVVVFLASPRSSYITGATLAADGGRTAG